jgi:SHS2 domain-containing protein
MPTHPKTQGHRLLPHTADLIIEAWGRARNQCIEQAALGLVESFLDVRSAVASESVITDLPAMDDVELLITVLEEVIYVVDAKGMVPVAASLREERTGGFRAVFDVVPLDDVTSIGPVPKGIARHAMHFGEDDGSWSCHVIVDV